MNLKLYMYPTCHIQNFGEIYLLTQKVLIGLRSYHSFRKDRNEWWSLVLAKYALRKVDLPLVICH